MPDGKQAGNKIDAREWEINEQENCENPPLRRQRGHVNLKETALFSAVETSGRRRRRKKRNCKLNCLFGRSTYICRARRKAEEEEDDSSDKWPGVYIFTMD